MNKHLDGLKFIDTATLRDIKERVEPVVPVPSVTFDLMYLEKTRYRKVKMLEALSGLDKGTVRIRSVVYENWRRVPYSSEVGHRLSSSSVRKTANALLPERATLWTIISPTFNILAFEKARYGISTTIATLRLRTLPLRVQASHAVCGGVMNITAMLHVLHLLLHGRPFGSRNHPRLWGERHKVFKEARMTNLLLKSTLDRIQTLRAVDPTASSKRRQLSEAKNERLLQNWFLPAPASKKFQMPKSAYKAKPYGSRKRKANSKAPAKDCDKGKQRKTPAQPAKATAPVNKRKRSVKPRAKKKNPTKAPKRKDQRKK
jgi:hypothetical protein